MAIITGGNIIGGNVIEGAVRRPFVGNGAPVGGTTLDGTIVAGDFYVDSATGNLYEFTDVDTFTRIDTV